MAKDIIQAIGNYIVSELCLIPRMFKGAIADDIRAVRKVWQFLCQALGS